METAVAIERDPGDVARRASRGERDVARDPPARPEGVVCDGRRHRAGADGKLMEATPAIEDVAAAAVAQQHEAHRDVPVGPHGAATDGGRATELMNAAPAVERVALGGSGRRARKQDDVARDIPTAPI